MFDFEKAEKIISKSGESISLFLDDGFFKAFGRDADALVEILGCDLVAMPPGSKWIVFAGIPKKQIVRSMKKIAAAGRHVVAFNNMQKAIEKTPFDVEFKEFKKNHPNRIGLFRCGDFYEVFCEDAEKLHKILGLTLTVMSRGKDFPMAGFPRHSLEVNIRKLLEAGERVAILEQAK